MMGIIPKAGETWRAKSGRIRDVTFVNDDDLVDDGRWAFVYYTRPSPAAEASAVVTLKQWKEWVEREKAFRTQKTWRAT